MLVKKANLSGSMYVVEFILDESCGYTTWAQSESVQTRVKVYKPSWFLDLHNTHFERRRTMPENPMNKKIKLNLETGILCEEN